MKQMTDYPFLVPSFCHIVDRHTYKAWSVPSESWDFHNIMLIVGGEGTAITNGVAQQLLPGMLVYHPVGESFGYETCADNLMQGLGGNFDLALLRPREELIAVKSLPLETYSAPQNLAKLTKLFTDLAQAWSDGMNQNLLRCRSIFLSILEELVHNSPTEEHKHFLRIQHVVHYMERYSHRRITLAELAELAGLTPSYFGQTFRLIKGVTPIAFLNSIRIDKALNLMESGCSLGEASAQAGFCDPFYFSRVFKKEKGSCPSAFMKSEMAFRS